MPIYLLIGPAKSRIDDLRDFSLPTTEVVDMDKAIKGGVTALGHIRWIEVASFSFKEYPDIEPPQHGDPKEFREFTVPSFRAVTLTRSLIDGISPLLMRWNATGVGPVKQPVAIIHMVKQNRIFYHVRLTGVEVSGYQTTGAGSTTPGESFTLQFSQFMLRSEYSSDPDDDEKPSMIPMTM
jgi:type VI protein secretion system component Hcp